eukprot:COSAG02_NODE_137_length_34526_cov_94.448079_24_plen_67_part_00
MSDVQLGLILPQTARQREGDFTAAAAAAAQFGGNSGGVTLCDASVLHNGGLVELSVNFRSDRPRKL